MLLHTYPSLQLSLFPLQLRPDYPNLSLYNTNLLKCMEGRGVPGCAIHRPLCVYSAQTFCIAFNVQITLPLILQQQIAQNSRWSLLRPIVPGWRMSRQRVTASGDNRNVTTSHNADPTLSIQKRDHSSCTTVRRPHPPVAACFKKGMT